ncbi:MAG: hypothetical protein ABIF10_02080 [Candidatus Woesearchaeota archaeon]
MKTAAWLILLVILAGTAAGLGIVPSSKEILFEPGKEETIELLVKNNEAKSFNAMVYAEGELAKYITVTEDTIELKSTEQAKKIVLKISMPESMDRQGEILTQIVVRETGSHAEGVSAYLAVASKLKLIVPYSGKYAEARLLSPAFIRGQESNFAVEVSNLGTEAIEEAQAFIDIIGPLGNKITTLTGEKKRVEAKGKALLIVKWVPELNNGPYRAVATVIYDAKTATDETDFAIGEPTLSIDSVSVTGFTLGGIAKFDILVSSNWGLPMQDVYGQVQVGDPRTTYTSYKTASMAVEPYGKQLFAAYWDTDKVLAGNYRLDMMFSYLDKTTAKQMDIVVEPNKIKIPEVGMATTEIEASTKTSVKVLAAIVALVLILTIFNNILLWKKLKK